MSSILLNKSSFAVLTEHERRLPLYITSSGGWSNQERIVRESGFPDFHWLQVYSGEGRLELSGNTYTVLPGQGMLLYPDEPHTYYAASEPWGVRWLTFNGGLARELLQRMALTESKVLTLSNPGGMLVKMHEAHETIVSGDPLRSYEGSSLMYELLIDLLRYSSEAEARSKQQRIEHIAPVLRHIEQHYCEPLSLPELAACIEVSPQYLCTLFQQAMGMRPFEYITSYRLRAAKELLLAEPERRVRDIAEACGYEHPSYFIKIFREHEGMTPTTFRHIHLQYPAEE
ncbi:AraC family transcriptional regulator [Paenibacillus turpanensis]|uniref:AraC family transcriptional regulator n=1 Tax=Paenibacillus turpanensis TaxID=2689078 RepID=UPI00140BB545|nr:AraC family transcriptional regulator [Paenibacillus turpanensis]